MIKQCIWCGKTFETDNGCVKRCPDCYEKPKQAKKKKKSHLKKPVKTIAQVTKELEQYNKEHKTNLTYGKFLVMKGW